MITLKDLKDAARELGMTVSYNADTQEYRVNFRNGVEATAYYTNDRLDALQTMTRMCGESEDIV